MKKIEYRDSDSFEEEAVRHRIVDFFNETYAESSFVLDEMFDGICVAPNHIQPWNIESIWTDATP